MVRKGKMRMKVNDNGIVWLHIDSLYACLCDLGYEMSDEEKALQDGTHEVFSHKGS